MLSAQVPEKSQCENSRKNGERELNEMPAKMFKRKQKRTQWKKNWQYDYAFRNDVVYRTEYFMNFHLDLHLNVLSTLSYFSLVACFASLVEKHVQSKHQHLVLVLDLKQL